MSSTLSVPVRFRSNATGTSPDTLVEVGGHDITKHVRGLSIEAHVGQVTSVNIDAIARDGFDVTLPARVSVAVLPLEEGVMDVTTLADGTQRYRFIRSRHGDDA